MRYEIHKLVIDRTLKDGRSLRVGWADDGQTCVTEVAGHNVGATAGYGRQGSISFVHATLDGRAVRIMITAEEAVALDAVYDQLYEAYRQTPAGLEEERRHLARNVGIAEDVDREERNDRWERGDETGAFALDRNGEIGKARQALADFDAAHPEVAASINVAAERRREAMLQDQVDYRGE